MEAFLLIAVQPFTTTDVVFLIIMIVLLLLSALASGSEVAFFSLTPGDLSKLKENGNTKVFTLMKKPEYLLATILVTNNFVNVGIVTISTYLVTSIFTFENPIIAFAIQIVLVTFLILLFGEIMPKLYAARNRIGVTTFTAGTIILLGYIFKPISSLLVHSTSIISRRMTAKNSVSMDELSKALELTSDSDISEEKDILEGIVRFTNIYVEDIISPRINIIAIDQESSFSEVKAIIIEHGYSRIPVYKDDLDSIVGVLYIKDLLQHLNESDDFKWQELLRPPYFVPGSKKINDLLEEFQSQKVHLAVVVDEYGGTSGIVTMEDILEEIIGEINDEYDDQQDKQYVKTKNNAFIFDASTLLNDFTKIIDIDKDSFKDVEGEPDTLAGLILEITGELPKRGEAIDFKDMKFTILDVDDRRIKKIKVEKNSTQDTSVQE